MNGLGFVIRAGLVACGLGASPALAPAYAQDAPSVPSGVRYELIDTWDVERLNTILETDMPVFTGVEVTYSPATNGVRLYRVTYPSVVPEMGNRPIMATGLLAIPETEGASFPLLSYQHGTVYGKEQVPSFPEQSGETQMVVALFAGQGYLVIGADYFGMGGGASEPEGYIVKASHQQATFDMLNAAKDVLATMGIGTDELFLSGWSQGGFVTMAFLEKLEASGVAVTAASTASAPTDAFAILSGFLDFPRDNDANWVNILYVLTAFSYENYYGVPGLARSLFNDAHYEAAKKIYDRDADSDFSALPTDLHELIRAEYFDPQFFAASSYGRIALATTAYRWIIQSPVRNYYGATDEVVSEGLARLPMDYQRAIGGGNDKVEAISTGDTDHRGTFGKAAAEWKTWFDSLK